MPSGGTGRFLRSERLLDSRDYARISRQGQRTSGHAFVVLLEAHPGQGGAEARRLGISASRRVGNAVTRNRLKRGVREWFRRRREKLPRGVDIVVIARRPAAGLSVPEIWNSLDELVERARKRWLGNPGAPPRQRKKSRVG